MTKRAGVALVTGGAGFIGSHMTDLLLQEGLRVRVLDNLSGGHERNLAHHSNNSSLEFDERDIRTLEPNDAVFSDVRYIFHFAGIGDIVPSIEQPIEYLDVNVQGTIRMLEGARQAQSDKFVYAASSSCYGLADVPTPESGPISPQYPYALSKYLGELAVLHWYNVYKLPANSVRIFNVFGTRSRTSGAYGAVFGVFLRQKLAGVPFTVVGDGTQRRDFVYVTDVARAFLAASRTPRSGEIWNIARSEPQSINYLVQLLGGDVVHVPRRPGEPECTWADTTKIRQELGWEPKVPFETGVREMLGHLDYWADAPLWDADSIARATEPWFVHLSGDITAR